MDEYYTEVISKKAAEIRKEIKAGALFGVKVDESDSDAMLVAAYSIGLSEYDKEHRNANQPAR